MARPLPLGPRRGASLAHQGEYLATEEAIQEALPNAPDGHEWPPPLEPLRPSDAPGATVAPTPGSSRVEGRSGPATGGQAEPLELDYEGGAYAAVDGRGEITARLDGAALGRSRIPPASTS